MFFSDIKIILNDAKIIGKLNKKKIKYLTDHSNNANPQTLLVIYKNKNETSNESKDWINPYKPMIINYHFDFFICC